MKLKTVSITDLNKLIMLELNIFGSIKKDAPVCIIVSQNQDFDELKKVLKEFLDDESKDTIIYHLKLDDANHDAIEYLFSEMLLNVLALPAFLLFKNQKLDSQFFGLLK